MTVEEFEEMLEAADGMDVIENPEAGAATPQPEPVKTGSEPFILSVGLQLFAGLESCPIISGVDDIATLKSHIETAGNYFDTSNKGLTTGHVLIGTAVYGNPFLSRMLTGTERDLLNNIATRLAMNMKEQLRRQTVRPMLSIANKLAEIYG